MSFAAPFALWLGFSWSLLGAMKWLFGRMS